MNQNTIIVIIVAAALAVLAFMVLRPSKKEHYRDPIYLNRAKYLYDYYPRANGTIYGELANIYSGHPYYFKAY